MNRWEDTVLTDKGAALQAKLADGQTLKITKVMTGASKVPVVNLRQQTSVTDGGKRIILQPPRTEGDQFIIPVLLENSGLEESYEFFSIISSRLWKGLLPTIEKNYRRWPFGL